MVDEKAKAQPEPDYSFSPVVCQFSPDGRVTEGVRQVSWRGYSLFWFFLAFVLISKYFLFSFCNAGTRNTSELWWLPAG